MCQADNFATYVNEKFKLTKVSLKPIDCGCLKTRLVTQTGTERAMRLAETGRQLFVNSMGSTLSRKPVDFSIYDVNDLANIQSFLGNIGSSCAARP